MVEEVDRLLHKGLRSANKLVIPRNIDFLQQIHFCVECCKYVVGMWIHFNELHGYLCIVICVCNLEWLCMYIYL